MENQPSSALTALSWACLIGTFVMSVPVIERISAAYWQWKKFEGYSNDGHITLSLETGIFFSVLLSLTFLVAAGLNYRARRIGARREAAVSRWAMYSVAIIATSYWSLGVSSYNVWRA
jgi:hypothetical protein